MEVHKLSPDEVAAHMKTCWDCRFRQFVGEFAADFPKDKPFPYEKIAETSLTMYCEAVALMGDDAKAKSADGKYDTYGSMFMGIAGKVEQMETDRARAQLSYDLFKTLFGNNFAKRGGPKLDS